MSSFEHVQIYGHSGLRNKQVILQLTSFFCPGQVSHGTYLGLSEEYQPVQYYTALGAPVHLFQFSPRHSDTRLPGLQSVSDLTEAKAEPLDTRSSVHVPGGHEEMHHQEL